MTCSHYLFKKHYCSLTHSVERFSFLLGEVGVLLEPCLGVPGSDFVVLGAAPLSDVHLQWGADQRHVVSVNFDQVAGTLDGGSLPHRLLNLELGRIGSCIIYKSGNICFIIVLYLGPHSSTKRGQIEKIVLKK